LNQQAKIIIAGLSILAIVLAIGLAVSLAMGDDDMHTNANGNHYMGMMQSMGNMDSNAMLDQMREVLGEDGYQRMLSHMQDHRNGAAMPTGSSIDDMMHRMMDGMMQEMPDDSGGNMPMGPH
jgi:hypothetical protein